MKTVPMKTVERCQRRCSGVLIVKCEHVSHFVLIFESKQASVYRVYFENTNTFDTNISDISCVMQYFQCVQNLLTNSM